MYISLYLFQDLSTISRRFSTFRKKIKRKRKKKSALFTHWQKNPLYSPWTRQQHGIMSLVINPLRLEPSLEHVFLLFLFVCAVDIVWGFFFFFLYGYFSSFCFLFFFCFHVFISQFYINLIYRLNNNHFLYLFILLDICSMSSSTLSSFLPLPFSWPSSFFLHPHGIPTWGPWHTL